MKKILLLALTLAALPLAALAQVDAQRGWDVQLKRIALNLTSTSVKHAKEYQGFADTRLSADNQSMLSGDLDFYAGLHTASGLWANSLLAKYGKTRVEKAVDDAVTKTESADQISFTTDYAVRMWYNNSFLGGFSFGPFVNGGYDTEFTAKDGANRTQIARARAGLKLFEGQYLKNFYAAGVYEYDFTYNPASSNLAWEVGLQVEQPLREGVKATYGGYFRDYLDYGEPRDIDVDYEAGLNARLDVLVLGNFAVAPVVNYFLAQGSNRSDLGQNLFVGVSFSWSRIFMAPSEG